jgi:hypothetical protein
MPHTLLADMASDLYVVLTGERLAPDLDLTYQGLKHRIVHYAAQHPIDSMVAATLGGSLLFYLAEHEHNPRVNSVVDAFWAVSSCIAAVSDAGGATTPVGKALLGWVMGIGPGLQALVGAEGVSHRAVPPPAAALDPVVVERLEHIATLIEQLLERQATAQAALARPPTT